MAQIGQMPAQSVHQARTLTHQPLPATVQQHSSLLVSRLDRHTKRIVGRSTASQIASASAAPGSLTAATTMGMELVACRSA